jgi:hypothetical protein
VREVARQAREVHPIFLLNLQPQHPLYGSPEARAARGEASAR